MTFDAIMFISQFVVQGNIRQFIGSISSSSGVLGGGFLLYNESNNYYRVRMHLENP